MSSQTLNILKADLVNDASTGTLVQTLNLLITPQPTMSNGASVPSSYVLQYPISPVSSAQISAYTPTSANLTPTITLSTNV